MILPQWFLQISVKEKNDHIITVKWNRVKSKEVMRLYSSLT